MKSIFRKLLFGLGAILFLVLVLVPQSVHAAAVCDTLSSPTIRMVIPGYGDWTTTTGNPHQTFNITLPSGTPSLTATVYTFAEPSSRDYQTWPNGQSFLYGGPLASGRSHTTSNPITSGTSFTVNLTQYCQDNAQVGHPIGPYGPEGSLTVNVTIATPYTLSVSKVGSGTVTSSPAGVNCGADCSEAYAPGTSVTLSQTPAAGSTFAGWSGACTGTGSCVVSMTQARSVTATFNAGYTLTVAKAGTGTGTITSSPAGINYGGDNSETYASGTSVNLTATAAVGSTFSGWSGSVDCSNDAGGAMANPTNVMMNAAKSCTATFDVGTAPSCSASPSTVAVGQSVIITAAGGSGGISPYYTWSTGSGGGACVAGGTCTTSYSSPGTKTVTVTRNGVQGTCTISASNNPPTAAFTGSSACTVNGWGDDIDTTVARPIRIYSDGNLVSTVTAGASGCAGSACTFSADLSSLISTGVAHTITGQIQGDTSEWIGFTNPQTSLSLTCPVTGVTCSGPSTGQTNTNYSFTATGGAAHTWSASSPAGTMTPSGTTGSGSSVTKSFSAAGTKTITFTRTDTGATGQCSINISTGPVPLTFNLQANLLEGPLTVAYNTAVNLSWVSGGASSVQIQGATPADPLWVSGSAAVSGSRAVSPATLRRVYNASAVNTVPQTVSDSVIIRVTPECLPAGQTVTVGQNATLTARGGDGTYAWTATGGTTASGSGSSFTTSYATEGTKTVSLMSDALTATACTVTVYAAPVTTGTIIVRSTEPSTWSLTGPSAIATEGGLYTTLTYMNLVPGTYTLSAGTLSGYQTPTVAPATSQYLGAGETKIFDITYTALAAGNIDLEVNNSDGPVQVVEGASGLLTWTSSNIVSGSCVASGGWSGARGDEEGAGVSTGAINDDTTFTITCDASAGGSISDEVDVTTRLPECRDGINNDTEDTRIDFAGNDLGCTNADDDDETNGVPECSDGIDNSDAEDTIADYPDDPGCLSANDDNEDDVEITECSDGFDNDGDGGVDDADAECTDPTDTSERATPDIREI